MKTQNDKRNITFRLSDNEIKQVRDIAKSENKTLTDIIKYYLNQYILESILKKRVEEVQETIENIENENDYTNIIKALKRNMVVTDNLMDMYNIYMKKAKEFYLLSKEIDISKIIQKKLEKKDKEIKDKSKSIKK